MFFLLPQLTFAVKPVDKTKELNEDKEIVIEEKRNRLDKFLLRKFLNKAHNTDAEENKLKEGHWSLILSGVSFLLFYSMITFGSSIVIPYVYGSVLVLSFLVGIAAIYFGIKSLKNKKRGSKKEGRTAGIFGIVIGSIMTLFYLLLAIFLSIIL